MIYIVKINRQYTIIQNNIVAEIYCTRASSEKPERNTMKKINWQILMVPSLIAVSVFLYFIHFMIYDNADHILNSVLARIAFVPIQVLLIALVINRLLTYHEKRKRREKLNMIIGAFFTEIGNHLLAYFSTYDSQEKELSAELNFDGTWTDAKFEQLNTRLKKYNFSVQTNEDTLTELYNFLQENRVFLLRLLENPNILDHKSFSNLLLATFHLSAELQSRKTFTDLPVTDHQHLAIDIQRAYKLLVNEWLLYLNYLRKNYPYFFSHAIRTNPFDEDASPIVGP